MTLPICLFQKVFGVKLNERKQFLIIIEGEGGKVWCTLKKTAQPASIIRMNLRTSEKIWKFRSQNRISTFFESLLFRLGNLISGNVSRLLDKIILYSKSTTKVII